MERKVLENYSEKLKALSHPIRLKITLELLEKDCTVNELCKKLSVAQATVSQHLSILRNRGVIFGNRNGTSISYGLSSNIIRDMLIQLKASTDKSNSKGKAHKDSKSTMEKNMV